MRVGPGSQAVAASPGGFLPCSLGVLLGSAAAAVLAGLLTDPIGAALGALAGAVVGGAAGIRSARYLNAHKREAYWRDRPCVDTEFANLECDTPLAPDLSTNPSARQASLGDVAAAPHVQTGIGARARTLGDLAARGQ